MDKEVRGSLSEAEFYDGFQMLLLWTSNQQAEIFFTAISLDAHNNNIRFPSQNSASDDPTLFIINQG